MTKCSKPPSHSAPVVAPSFGGRINAKNAPAVEHESLEILQAVTGAIARFDALPTAPPEEVDCPDEVRRAIAGARSARFYLDVAKAIAFGGLPDLWKSELAEEQYSDFAGFLAASTFYRGRLERRLHSAMVRPVPPMQRPPTTCRAPATWCPSPPPTDQGETLMKTFTLALILAARGGRAPFAAAWGRTRAQPNRRWTTAYPNLTQLFASLDLEVTASIWSRPLTRGQGSSAAPESKSRKASSEPAQTAKHSLDSKDLQS